MHEGVCEGYAFVGSQNLKIDRAKPHGRLHAAPKTGTAGCRTQTSPRVTGAASKLLVSLVTAEVPARERVKKTAVLARTQQ